MGGAPLSSIAPPSTGGMEHPASVLLGSVASYLCQFMLTCDIPMYYTTNNRSRFVARRANNICEGASIGHNPRSDAGLGSA